MRSINVQHIINTLDAKDGGAATAVVEIDVALNADADTKSGIFAFDWWSWRRPVASVMNLKSFIVRSDVVVIHGYFLWWVPVVAVMCRTLNRRLLLNPHGSLSDRQRRYSTFRKSSFSLIVRPVMRLALHSWVVGSDGEGLALRADRVGKPVSVIGVPVPDARGDSRSDSNSNSLKLVSVSRLAPKKRLDVFIEVVGELVRRGWCVDAVIAGSGEAGLLRALRAKVDALSLNENVTFAGWLGPEHRSQLLYAADVFLLPSEDENFGIAPIEAMMHGVPVVVSGAVASLKGVVSDGIRVVQSGKVTDYADAVIGFFDGEEINETIRSNAQLTAEQLYGHAAIITQWRAALLNAIKS